VEVLLEAIDPDDSLRVLRVNFLGGAGDWLRAETPDTAKGPGKWWKLWRHAYGRPGAFAIEGCVSAADGRETCQKARIEIFNAPPVCEPAADVKATLGLPTEIEGKGRDPDGSIVKWEWDLDGDGRFDVASRKDGKVKYTFARAGLYSLTFRVTTADGSTATAVRKVDVRKKWKD
ncbi:MAG TPA: PKD domain-containing protein, partial [Fibrobacteria bacterium]|nr:PKD domain-containing protein [Fibrobacteria bacterium]